MFHKFVPYVTLKSERRKKDIYKNIYVDEGQYVKAGQLLFRIMPGMYQAELLKAQAEAKGAEIELQNAKTLPTKI